MQKLILTLTILLTSLSASAQKLTSPNGKLEMNFRTWI